MLKQDFIPKGEGDLYKWLVSLKAQLALLPANTIAAAQTTAMIAFINGLVTALDKSTAAEQAYHAAVDDKNAVKKSSIDGLRGLIQTFKHSPTYTESAGKALGIIGENNAIDLTTLKPLPKIKKTVSGVLIKYAKKGADGAIIYCKRGSETAFTRLEKVTLATYTDSRPNLDGAAAEVREYYLIAFKSDTPIGLESDVVSIKA